MIAAVLTVVALPFLWSAKQEQAGPESVAALGATGGVGTESVAAAGLEPPETDIGEALAVSVTPVASGVVDDGIVTIDVAPPASGESAEGTASYRRWPSELTSEDRPCGSPIAPFGERIVVTNTDNGYKIACTNVSTKPLVGDAVIVIDTDVFLELADLGDAPLPVQISW